MTRARPSLLISLLEPVHRMLMRHLVTMGAIRFVADGGDAGDTSLMADPPQGGEGGQPAGDGKPAGEGDQPADGKPAGEGAKPADGKPAGEGGKPAGEKPAGDKPQPKAPEKYEFKAPEGFELDDALQTAFDPVLRELDLTNEQAQKLIDFAPQFVGKHVEVATAEVVKAMGYEGFKGWTAQSKADTEFGGDKLAENLAVVRAARDQFATPELRKLLETTPLGNHPEVLRLFFRIGKQITPDGYVPNGKATGTTNTAKRLYDNSQMNP